MDSRRPDYVALKALFRHWQQGMHNRAWNALFWCNHDQPRIVSRFGDEGEYRVTAAKMLAMVLHGMQGTPYIYQGEEIGMTNPHFSSISDYRDVESHNMFIERAAQGKARTNCWRSSPASRATTAARRCRGTPARTVASATVSRGSALAIITRRSTSRRRWPDPDSVFYTYQQLITLRKTLPLLTWGDYEDLLPEHPSLWCYRRQWQGQTLVVAANLSRELQAWQPAEAPGEWKMIISNYAETTPRPTGLTLRPFEAIWWLQG